LKLVAGLFPLRLAAGLEQWRSPGQRAMEVPEAERVELEEAAAEEAERDAL
jgi:hypothetical protein